MNTSRRVSPVLTLIAVLLTQRWSVLERTFFLWTFLVGCEQGRISGEQRERLPRPPRFKGPPWWNLFVSNKILVGKGGARGVPRGATAPPKFCFAPPVAPPNLGLFLQVSFWKFYRDDWQLLLLQNCPLQWPPQNENVWLRPCLLEKFLWFRSATRIQLYIIFLCCVNYQWPTTANDFSTSLTVCQFKQWLLNSL